MSVENRAFSALTEAERGALDPAAAYRPGPTEPFAFLDVELDDEAHPVAVDDEELRSRWMGAGGILYGYAGQTDAVTFGGMFCALSQSRLLAGWHQGIQGVRDEAPSLDNSPAQVAVAWRYESISQVFIEGQKRRLRGFEARQLRVLGGREGLAQIVVQAVTRADEHWLGARDANPADFQSFAESLARAAGQSSFQWMEGPSPLKQGEHAYVLEI